MPSTCSSATACKQAPYLQSSPMPNLAPNRTPLPVDDYLSLIQDALVLHQCVVVVAEPGAGKTSRVPPALLADPRIVPPGQYLVMLQPRRTAARSAAEWIAHEQGWRLGAEVGYQVRFESRIGPETRLQVVTEGILTRRLLNDPALSGCSAVILDEFHERSLDADLALMLLAETRSALRPELSVVVMSATIDAKRIAQHLGGCPIVTVPGRTFPVSVTYDQTAPHLPPIPRTAKAVEAVLATEPAGDVLVFLPGAREIREVDRQLRPLIDSQLLKNTEILSLYGAMSLSEQITVLQPGPKRRVILSTNIAETSLTIHGVTTVVDSGLARQAGFDDVSGVDTLKIRRISAASASQRAGRAGRTAPGRCVRLWSAQETLDPFDPPEMQRLDLSGFILACLSWGWRDLETIDWLSAPSPDHLKSALELLQKLGAIEPETNRLTPIGRALATMPVHPRLGRILLESRQLGRVSDGAIAVALISERDFLTDELARRMAGREGHKSDILLRLDIIKRDFDGPISGIDSEALARVRQVASHLERIASNLAHVHRPVDPPIPSRADHSDQESILARLLLTGFSDRVCRRTKPGNRTAFMARGLGVRLAPTSLETDSEFFLALDPRREEATIHGSEPLVRIAIGLEKEWLENWLKDRIETHKSLDYDEPSGRARWFIEKRLHQLVISTSQTQASDPELADAFRLWAADHAEELLRESPEVADWMRRYDTLRKFRPELNLPDPDWPDAATNWSSGCMTRNQLRSRPGLSWVQATLPIHAVRMVDEDLPETITLPNGRTAKIDYNSGLDQPMIQARVQDFFGWQQSPTLAGGRLPILLEILAPNHKPVQRTLDLRSFWANTYPQVRKDLRGRYPKHHWPEDPWSATAGPSIRKKTDH